MLPHCVADWAEREPERRALTFVHVDDSGALVEETRSYGQLWDNGRRLAQLMKDTGMRRDDHFAIMMQNHPEFVDAMVASGVSDTIFVCIDPRVQGDSLRFMLEFAECKGIVIADYALPQLQKILPDLGMLRWIWVVATSPTFKLPVGLPNGALVSDLLEIPVPDLEISARDPSAPMTLLYTSGTTGDPKAIMTPYSRMGVIAGLGDMLGMGAGNVLYTGLSLTHANAQLITLGNALWHGSHGVISRRFTKSRLWDICRAYDCTQFNLLGGMTTAIYSEPVRPNDADNPVQRVLSAGMPAGIWKQFEQRFNLRVYEFYGTAEGGLTFNPPDVGPIGSVGKPPPNMIAKVVDGNDDEVPPGEHGELVFKNADGSTPHVEYYKLPEASVEKTRGGWFRTGDIFYADEDGWLYFVHRIGDAIRSSGDFIDPNVIQKILAEHPDIDDVFVYGIPAESGVPGEKDVVAAVVPVSSDVEPARLFAYCRQHLSGNFVPKYIQFMKEIPKTASEKPQVRFCIDAFNAELGTVYTESMQ